MAGDGDTRAALVAAQLADALDEQIRGRYGPAAGGHLSVCPLSDLYRLERPERPVCVCPWRRALEALSAYALLEADQARGA